MTRYTIAFPSCGAAHFNVGLVIVFTLEIVIFTKNNIFIYIFFRHIFSHNSEVYTLAQVHTLRIDSHSEMIFVTDRLRVHNALMLSVT